MALPRRAWRRPRVWRAKREAEARRREIGWLNLNWFMTNLLDRKDRMSMYSGLEVRVPFCDHHLVDYALEHSLGK